MLDRRLAGPSVVDADQVAIDALGFIGSDPKLMNRFLDVTGIEADGIRQAAVQPGFLVGVLDFIMAHEPDLVSFCHATATPLEIVQIARDRLDAGR